MPRAVVAIGAAIACAAPGGAARAADWANAGSTATASYDIDLDTVAVDGKLVRSWTRETLATAQRDPKTGKLFVSTTQQRFDDCAQRRYTLGAYVIRDAQGQVVTSGSSLAQGPQKAVPGGIAEGVERTACAVAHPPKEEPIPLRPGTWTDVGVSADGQVRVQVMLDHVRKADDGLVYAILRSVLAKPEWPNGVPVRLVVSATAIDCAGGRAGLLGADFYISPKVRVDALRPTKAESELEEPDAGSPVTKSGLKLICDAATPETREGQGPQKGRGGRGAQGGVHGGGQPVGRAGRSRGS